MSELVKKALSNFSAAELLIEKKNYSPSIHCAYYSSLQIILFLIKSKLSKTWKNYYKDSKDAAIALKQPNESIHNLYISFIKQDINKTDVNTQRKFSTDIGILKKYRNNSDYTEIEIKDKIADQSIQLAKNINSQLIKHYQL